MTTRFERTVERALGESIEAIRMTTVAQRRASRELVTGKPVRYVSCFPLIGRGNVLRDKAVDHRTADAILRKALRGE